LDCPLLRLRREVARRRRETVDARGRSVARLDALLRQELTRRLARGGLARERELDDRVLIRATRHHGLRRGLGLPSLRESDLEAEIGMEEAGSLEVPLPRILPERESLDVLEILVPVDDRVRQILV